jgi:multisubunit Na+/H+ antiporter MnhC subunit
MLDIVYYHIVMLVILSLGIYNLILSKNIVKSVLIIEMMLAATNVIFFQAAVRNGNDSLGQAVVTTSIVIGAGLTAFLLSLCVKAYREFGTLNPDKMKLLRG